MKRKANIFCASNPAKLADALWAILPFGDLSNLVIFLPSRRAVRTVERMIADKKGGAAILPKLVALGEANDEECDDPSADAAKANTPGTVSNLERTIVLSKMLSAANGFGIGANITVAKDLIRMTDYLENEKTENKRIEWQSLVDDKYAEHFREKAKFFDLAQNALPLVFTGRETVAERRNKDIRSWIGALEAYDKVIVCGSTASVPATADLMKYIAWLDNGYIILPGDVRHKITAHNACDPYDAELKFLESVSVRPADVRLINVGESAIGFLNGAFDNPMSFRNDAEFVRIDCAREAEEAEVVAEIATEKSAAGKSVLIVSPDISAAQRLSESLLCRGASFDFSGGTKGGSTQVGRFILNLLDGDNDFGFHNEYKKSGLFDAVVKVAEEFTDEESITVIEAVRDLSDILSANGLELSPGDLRAAIAECLNGVSIRGPRNEGALISIVGTIESRMQTADVVILAGLNEGMFPATGYENPWLPRRAAEAIGLPAPERKVSLMALDFINLSCGPEVYWTRSKMSGGADTTESRFLSRVSVAEKCAVCSVQCEVDDKDGNLNAGEGDTITAHCTLHTAHYWLNKVRALDNIPYEPLDASPPRPPSTNDDVYVTGLELLIHNPYAFYARHILKLRLKDDPEREADARDFGILAHEAIERLATNNEQLTTDKIVADLDARAKKKLGDNSVLFHFWHKRFQEIAPAVTALLQQSIEHKAKGANDLSGIEVPLNCVIAGRTVRARADMIIGDVVLDIKTGSAPSRKQLEEGNMPQLPLEAYMLGTTVMRFLQLKNRDIRTIEYKGKEAAAMIGAAVQKASELFGRYAKDFEPYEHRVTSDEKYKEYDDLARVA